MCSTRFNTPCRSLLMPQMEPCKVNFPRSSTHFPIVAPSSKQREAQKRAPRYGECRLKNSSQLRVAFQPAINATVAPFLPAGQSPESGWSPKRNFCKDPAGRIFGRHQLVQSTAAASAPKTRTKRSPTKRGRLRSRRCFREIFGG